jgi:xanthosine utilization system XapX-like protein
LVACTIVGITNGATLPLITFYALTYVLSYSLLTLEPEAPPSLAIFFLLRSLLGDSDVTFFLFSSVVCISVRQLLFLYSWFYKVIMLESTNATGEGKMQMYL